MTLTKEQLTNSVYLFIESRSKAARVVDALFETIKQTMEQGDDVLVSGFGKFQVRDKKGRRGRNPSTGADLFLDARRVITYKSSGVLVEKINNNTSEL